MIALTKGKVNLIIGLEWANYFYDTNSIKGRKLRSASQKNRSKNTTKKMDIFRGPKTAHSEMPKVGTVV